MKLFQIKPNLTIKQLIIITTTLSTILLTAVIVISYFNPTVYSNRLTLSELQDYTITKKDWFNPIITYQYSPNPCKERKDNEQFPFIIVEAKRNYLGQFFYNKSWLGQANCQYYKEYIELIKTKNLADPNQNPDGNKFQVDGIKVSDENFKWNKPTS
jgi:hypothetical protein